MAILDAHLPFVTVCARVPAPNTDPITGLSDRGECLRITTRMLRDADPGAPPAAVWLDIDRFKQINESFGHLAGNDVIADIARRLGQRVAGRGELARVGADEFVCLIPAGDRIGIETLAQEMLRTVEESMQMGGIQLRPNASIGIALCEDSDQPSLLLERADRAMIEAKRQGGGRIVVSGDEPAPGRFGAVLARDELAVENRLHQALENGGLSFHFQPILTLDGRLEAVEALMRCTVDGESISPARFIPVSEKAGLVIRLGEWSLMQGARHARLLEDIGIDTKVAINLSRAQLMSTRFDQTLHAALIRADATPARIELELTESLFLDDSPIVQNNLRAASLAGVGLVIDDFGTGYSCLANLRDIPATKLKLDRAFIVALPHDRRAFAIVRAMTRLGQELGMTIVAEGVERQDQLDSLRMAGVDATQGFLQARPMDGGTLIAWHRTREATRHRERTTA